MRNSPKGAPMNTDGRRATSAPGGITCREMAGFFRSREDHYEWSDRYIRDVHDSPVKSGRTEREHMVSWFGANPTVGSGRYSRKKGNNDARTCYSRLQNAASLLWIAEAVGVDGALVRRAYEAAVSCGDRRRACGAIRREIPWECVEAGYLELNGHSLGGLVDRIFRRAGSGRR